MAKTVQIAGATYTGVPSIQVPNGLGGIAIFIDEDDVITYYTGATAPASSLGQDGDIYLQTGG